MFNKKLLIIEMIFILICFCVFCSYGQDKLQNLVILTGTDASTFDPHFTPDSATEAFNKNIYNNLVKFDSELKILPDLAENWEISEDGFNWTFHLRKNIKFHDGTPFTAEAVKVSFERALNPETGAVRRSVLEIIDKVEVIDNNTVKIITSSPCGYLLNLLAHPIGAIISPSAIEKYGKNLATNPIGTGPFIFNEWKTDEEIILDRNIEYFDGAPQINRVIFKIIPDDSTRSLLLESGQADVALRLPVIALDRLKDRDDINIFKTNTLMNMYIPINSSKNYFKDVRVRQAMNYAIDKGAIVNDIISGMATIADSPISPETWGYYPIKSYEYNPEKAKKLLTEAGYPNGINGLEIWTAVGRYYMDVKVCESIQYQWQQVGIDAQIRQWEFQAMITEAQKAEYDMLLSGWSPSTADADQGIYPVFHSSQFPPKGYNRAFYENAEVDRLLMEAKTEINPDKRKELYKIIQETIIDEAPWIFLYYSKQAVVCRKNILGLEILPTEHILLHKVTKE